MIRQLPLPFDHRPRFAGVSFLQAESNAEAVAWLARTAPWPQGRLALWGEAGCGKTHLLHRWLSGQEHARLIDGVRLMLEPPHGPSAIDDADTAPERELLHWLNASAEAGFPVLLAGRQAPSRWPVQLPDLASRLRAATAVEIGPAEDELLRPLLKHLLVERQLQVSEAVQEYLLLRLPRTPAALREAAARLDRLALATGRGVTRALAAVVVAQLEEPALALQLDDDIAATPLPALPSLLTLL